MAEAEAQGQATMSSTSSSLQQQTLRKGSLVKICRLKSAQGEKLNDSYGILVNAEPFENGRYAVKIFATPIREPPEGMFEAMGFPPRPPPPDGGDGGAPPSLTSSDTTPENGGNKEEEGKGKKVDKLDYARYLYDHVKGFGWSVGKSNTKQLKPVNLDVSNDFNVGMAWAFNAMRPRLQRHIPTLGGEVCDFLYDLLREAERVEPNYFRPASTLDGDESSQQLHGHDGSALDAVTHAYMVMVFLAQNEVHLDMAFEHVLWIKQYGPVADFPPESTPWEKRYVMGLDLILSTTNKLLRRGNGFHPDHDTHTRVMVEVAKARLEMCPEGSLEATKYLGILGEAESFAGNHLEGAKLIRRAFALAAESTEGSLDDNTLTLLKESLLMAQLHSPGMMLEDHHVIQNFGSSVQAVHLNEKHMFRPDMVDGRVTGVTAVGRPQIFVVKIPTDYDDPVFDPIMPLIT